MNTDQQILNEIVAHANKEGGGYGSWYAGVASDPEQRLFSDHNVPRQDAWWIHREAASSTSARDVEAALLRLGFDGGPGGGDYTTEHVYAYRKILRVTNP